MSQTFLSLLQRYRRASGTLTLPVARGRVTYILVVEEDGTIEIQGGHLLVGRRYTGHYAKATIFTHRRQLRVQINHRLAKIFPFVIRERVAPPLRPLPCGRI